MTSGNVSDEPIAYRDDDALERLGRHRRPLPPARPADPHAHRRLGRAPSVGGRRCRAAPLARLRARAALPLPVRGRAPAARPAAPSSRARSAWRAGRRAWVGHHIGDLKNYETLRVLPRGRRALRAAVRRRAGGRRARPAPGLPLDRATRCERDGVELVGVQHHHAHLAACLAEHGERGPAVGAIFDGTGLGPDGTVWGGELLVGGLDGFERAGHLRPVRLPGGDAGGPPAVADGVRVAGRGARARTPALPPTLAGRVDAGALARRRAAGAQRPRRRRSRRAPGGCSTRSPRCAGCAPRSRYEGQAAVELEAARRRPAERGAYALAGRRAAIRSCSTRARRSSPSLADVEAGVAGRRGRRALPRRRSRRRRRPPARELARRRGLDTAVLSGGVFQNRAAARGTAAALPQAAGLRVLVPERLPPNDGGIAYGQAAVAAARGRR